jgi:hypothetical protein
MNSPHHRSTGAATRLLNAHAGGAPLLSVWAEIAAWLVGSAGGTIPHLPSPTGNLEARLAALLGAGDHAATEAFLLEYVPTPPGEKLLFSACMLAGDQMADTLVELAHRFRTPWFLGSMLTRTTRPDRLLALLGSDQRHLMRTICELVIAGRDQGTPIVEAEQRWAAIAREPYWNWSYMNEYCDGALRIKARENLDDAIDLLETFEQSDRPGYGHHGAMAVLARLVRADVAKAAQLTEDASSPRDRVIRLQGMAWWTELPEAAQPLVNDLMNEQDADVKLSLVRILAGCGAPPPFERALRGATPNPPLEVADQLALGVYLLRIAGRNDAAEGVRDRLVPTLDALVVPGKVAPLDLFDVISAPGRPRMAPWRTSPGLPFECP